MAIVKKWIMKKRKYYFISLSFILTAFCLDAIGKSFYSSCSIKKVQSRTAAEQNKSAIEKESNQCKVLGNVFNLTSGITAMLSLIYVGFSIAKKEPAYYSIPVVLLFLFLLFYLCSV
jgi:hypothetical protein